jgi:hypothetical protein
MKIGILTLPLNHNYGGILQAYALLSVLKRMGHEVWLIDRQEQKIPKWKYPLSIAKRISLKFIGKNKASIFYNEKKKRDHLFIGQYTIPFIKKYIQPQTITFHSSNELEKVILYNFDCYIVGSDQVWRPEYTCNIEDYFFGFLKGNEKRFSYAASFGTNEWEFSPEQTLNCAKLLQSFKSVSVRENTGINICKKYFDVNAVQVLDPTLLLNLDDYQQLVALNKIVLSGELLCYILDNNEEKKQIINIVSEKLDMLPFNVNTESDNFNAVLIDRIAPPVEIWLKSFIKAKYVITDSFHGCVFSILFNKPFIVYGNIDRGMERFLSLLSIFGLEKRLITTIDEFSMEIIETTIDWNKVNNLLEKERQISMSFLLNSLRK